MKFYINDLELETKIHHRVAENTIDSIEKRFEMGDLTVDELRTELEELFRMAHGIGHIRGEIYVKRAYRSMFEENGFEYE